MKAYTHKSGFWCALLLLAIYTTHLGVFNAMMFGSFQDKDNLIGYSFDNNSQSNTGHPCMAADYQRLLKHEDDKKHSFNFQSCNAVFLTALLLIPVTQPALKSFVALRTKFLPIANTAFRRYSLLNVFLI